MQKKKRLGYSWLSTGGDQLNSPPLLRTRRRIGGLDAVGIQQLVLDRPRTRKKKVPGGVSRSNSNSRASTPAPDPTPSREEEEEEEDEEEEDEAEDEDDEDDDEEEEGEDIGDEEDMGENDEESKNSVAQATAVAGVERDVRLPAAGEVRDVVETDELVEETVAPHATIMQSCVDDAVLAAMPQDEVEPPKTTVSGRPSVHQYS